jgi:lipoprotein Spr
MTLRSLISILALSFASFSAFSFQLPASMLSMNSELSASPAKAGLMQHIFSDAAHLELPRTTSEQIHRGVQVDQYRLKAGDLVFFQTGPNRKHVGVYIGDSLFIHASSSECVTVSTLTDNYWQEHFITARRVAGAAA